MNASAQLESPVKILRKLRDQLECTNVFGKIQVLEGECVDLSTCFFTTNLGYCLLTVYGVWVSTRRNERRKRSCGWTI
ncbi:hypothetical protein Y032_0117g663 [Ancylostoma ceylanicum]|uniref:Uncharacterized protein n=1 Tax=Ancylostoma ceylanicum TaxID=53326 RepID=A0A016TC24_9BILA|nr:hypothetical protein Y032_0117g663 [Ancylostoma ceylanicum]